MCLTGGEPTHHPRLRQLVRLAHQFGLTVSMVTSARTVAEVTVLSQVAPLLSNVTVSADSQGAMLLGRTTRTAASAIHTLRSVSTESRILHVTCWDLGDQECQDLADLVAAAGVEIQFSPVVLDQRALHRAGATIPEYLDRQQHDAEALSRHFNLSDRYWTYLAELRDLHRTRSEPERRPCRSATAYVSADGHIRRCPYGRASVTALAPRAEIGQFLTAPAQDRVTVDCAAICRSPDLSCDRRTLSATSAQHRPETTPWSTP